MNLRNAVVVGSLMVVVSGCSLLPEGIASRINPDKLFINDDEQVPVAVAAVETAPEKPGLKIRKSKRGNAESYVVRGERYYTLDSSEEYSARGTASWYGPNFHGRTASSGEIYDMYRLTAAHKTLPLPTYARVTHLENGRSIVVKINDRGPFSGDRIIDLSFAAALRLGMINDGTGEVEIQALSPEEVMVLSGPDNRLGVDFYHTDGEEAVALAKNNAANQGVPVDITAAAAEQGVPVDLAAADAEQGVPVNLTAADVDKTPITALPLADNAQPTLTLDDVKVDETALAAAQTNESLDNKLPNAELPLLAEPKVQVQGLVTVPAAAQAAEVKKPAAPSADGKSYYIQAGVFADVGYAERVAVDVVLASPGEEVHVKPLKNSDMYRITVGPIVTSEHAARVSGALTDAGFDNFTIRAQ